MHNAFTRGMLIYFLLNIMAIKYCNIIRNDQFYNSVDSTRLQKVYYLQIIIDFLTVFLVFFST